MYMADWTVSSGETMSPVDAPSLASNRVSFSPTRIRPGVAIPSIPVYYPSIGFHVVLHAVLIV